METVVPIAHYHGERRWKLEAPSQPLNDRSSFSGFIEFLPHQNIEQALEDLDGFSHCWVIFLFHQNVGWKPKVRPPRGSQRSKGLFATRSPYRPNRIGLSCCRIQSVEGRRVWLGPNDLLDQTPILDLKPYVASDRIESPTYGWTSDIVTYPIVKASLFSMQSEWLCNHGVIQLEPTCLQQLCSEPLAAKAKRVHLIETQDSYSRAVFCYRTWRIDFLFNHTTVTLLKIRSGYAAVELESLSDPYQDKDLHRAFTAMFSKSEIGTELQVSVTSQPDQAIFSTPLTS